MHGDDGYSRLEYFGGSPVGSMVLIYSPDATNIYGSTDGEFEGQSGCNGRQESLAIAKTTARCTQYMGALKSFESPRKHPRLLFPKFVKGFCSDRY